MNSHLEGVLRHFEQEPEYTVRVDSESLIVIKSDNFLEQINEVHVVVTQSERLDVRPVGYHEAFDRTKDGAIKFITNLSSE